MVERNLQEKIVEKPGATKDEFRMIRHDADCGMINWTQVSQEIP